MPCATPILGFATKSIAPNSKDLSVASAPFSVSVEVMTTGVGLAFISTSRKRNPSTLGISISSVITSGDFSRTSFFATKASGAAPTNAANNTIEFITIASTGNATDFGDLVQKIRDQSSAGNQTRGIFAGGQEDTANAEVNVIQYLTIASLGNSIDFGDLSVVRKEGNNGQVNSAVRAIFAGGYDAPNNFFNTIDYVTISTTGDAQDFGDLTQGRNRISGACNSTRGVFSGGYAAPTRVNTIDFITITSTGNAQDFGDISQDTMSRPGASSPTRGVFFGGGQTPGRTNSIEYITIAQTGNSVDFGDLIFTNSGGIGISNGHGGL